MVNAAPDEYNPPELDLSVPPAASVPMILIPAGASVDGDAAILRENAKHREYNL